MAFDLHSFQSAVHSLERFLVKTECFQVTVLAIIQVLAKELSATKAERDQLLAKVAILEQKLEHRHNERGAGRKSLNPDVVEKILQYRAAGMTIRAIADELGISVSTVKNYLQAKN